MTAIDSSRSTLRASPADTSFAILLAVSFATCSTM